METKQCENTHPMLPINDSCVGNIKSIIVGDKDLIIQDLKDVILWQRKVIKELEKHKTYLIKTLEENYVKKSLRN